MRPAGVGPVLFFVSLVSTGAAGIEISEMENYMRGNVCPPDKSEPVHDSWTLACGNKCAGVTSNPTCSRCTDEWNKEDRTINAYKDWLRTSCKMSAPAQKPLRTGNTNPGASQPNMQERIEQARKKADAAHARDTSETEKLKENNRTAQENKAQRAHEQYEAEKRAAAERERAAEAERDRAAQATRERAAEAAKWRCYGQAGDIHQGFLLCLNACRAFYQADYCKAECFGQGMSATAGQSCFKMP